MGFVYFIKAHGGAVKVGTALDPDKRLRALQTGSSLPLTLMALLPGDRALERRIHGRLDLLGLRMHGEWYEDGDALRSVLTELKQDAVPVEIRATPFRVCPRCDGLAKVPGRVPYGRDCDHPLCRGGRIYLGEESAAAAAEAEAADERARHRRGWLARREWLVEIEPAPDPATETPHA